MGTKKPVKEKLTWVDADNPNPFASALNDLLACPFCGGKAELFEHDDSGFSWDIRCGTPDCWMEDGGDWHFDKEWATKLWNRRSVPRCTCDRCTGNGIEKYYKD